MEITDGPSVITLATVKAQFDKYLWAYQFVEWQDAKDVNFIDEKGVNLLMKFLDRCDWKMESSLQVVGWLIWAGNNVNQVEVSANSPLVKAAMNGHTPYAVFLELIQSGADVH